MAATAYSSAIGKIAPVRAVRVPELDGLRGIAALAVVVSHYFFWIPYTAASYGWMGVDLFFVLSGFLITGILLDLKEKPKFFSTFYGRRAFRIFPPYFFVLGVYFITSVVAHRLGTLGFWSKYVFYYASLFPSPDDPAMLALTVYWGTRVLWSLSVEELFYTIWAPAVRFLRQRTFCILLAAMIVAAPVFRYCARGDMRDQVFSFYCRMDGLALGALVAVVFRLRSFRWGRATDLFFYCSSVAFAVFFALAGSNFRSPRVDVLGLTIANLFFASLVFFVVRRSGQVSGLLNCFRSRSLRSVGKVSYSIYLVHYPIYVVIRSWVFRDSPLTPGRLFLVDCAAVAGTFLVAYAMWHGFEASLLRVKDRVFPTNVDNSPPRDTHVFLP